MKFRRREDTRVRQSSWIIFHGAPLLIEVMDRTGLLCLLPLTNGNRQQFSDGSWSHIKEAFIFDCVADAD